jgi:DNA-binding MarR family transcriptional regulator/N-acetylglutamate synthase-like GNAT family acetyltransferase
MSTIQENAPMATMSAPGVDRSVRDVRRFNRFYTRQIGLLQEGVLQSPFSLTEVRALYEIAHRPHVTATAISSELGLDPGYLSRILGKFERKGLIERMPSETDGRQIRLALTSRGQKVFSPLNARQNEEVAAMLDKLPLSKQQRLLEAMRTIETVLGPKTQPRNLFLLRTHQPGDMGWVVHRHGVIYAQEYRYDERFEALVAEIVAEFIQKCDPKRERCWIAEVDGDIAGSVFLVQKSKAIAKLRLLVVEPWARGMGIGRRLVNECIRFARQVGYRRIILWTQSELSAARHLYEEAGFQLVKQEPHRSWGRDDLVAETWELDLMRRSTDGKGLVSRLRTRPIASRPPLSLNQEGRKKGPFSA